MAARRSNGWRRQLLRGFGWLAFSTLGVTILLVAPWRLIDPPTSAFILHYESASGQTASVRWADLDQISPQLALAVIAAEDQKFPSHHGFDFESIREVLSERQARGASTISQQVAKNLFLWPGRSWLRKGLEAWLTASIELLWPKRRILEIYLNVAEFGSGTYGAAAASRAFFGRSPRHLSTDQAARLAAILPSPRRMSAARPSRHVRDRTRQIREQMRLLGGESFLDQIRRR